MNPFRRPNVLLIYTISRMRQNAKRIFHSG